MNRNILGGFRTTQDTCIALKALSEYAIVSFIGGLDLTISLASTNFDFETNFRLNDTESETINRAQIPTLPTEIFVNAAGSGCALMQINVQYNMVESKQTFAFILIVKGDLMLYLQICNFFHSCYFENFSRLT